MYLVLAFQAIIKDLPLKICAMAHSGRKLIVATTEGTLLEYNVDEEPLSINLLQVHKKAIKSVIQIVILPASRLLAIRNSDGVVTLAEYSTHHLKLIPIPRIKPVTAMDRSCEGTVDELALGVKRGLIIYTVSSYNVVQGELIKLPATPLYIRYLTPTSVLIAAKLSLHIVDLTLKTSQLLFTPPASDSYFSTTPILVSRSENKGDIILYCTKDASCFRVNVTKFTSELSFKWTASPLQIRVEDYYCIGLIEDRVEVRSLKTGSLLQHFSLGAKLIVLSDHLRGTIVSSLSSSWRLIPLDFDDQIDDLLTNNRFEDAEAFINELQFDTAEEKESNIRKVRGGLSQYLFAIEKKYDQAISILEHLNASPIDILELFPDTLEDSEHAALQSLSRYLGRERVRLSSVVETEAFKEMVDTLAIQVFLLVDSPLLTGLILSRNYCEYEKTIDLLTRFKVSFETNIKKDKDLVSFYYSKGDHIKALEFLKL